MPFNPEELGGVLTQGENIAKGFLGRTLATDIVAGAGVIQKTYPNEDRRVFDLALGFIPQLNVGTALGMEGFSETLANILLDPFTYLLDIGGLTRMGRGLAASKYLSAAEKVNAARRIINTSDIVAKVPGLADELMGALKSRDIQTLSKWKQVFGVETEATKTFFRGPKGLALHDAIMGGTEGALATTKGAQAAAGQRALVKFHVPFTDIEKTLIPGESFYDVIDKVPGLGKWVQARTLKEVQAVTKVTSQAPAVLEAADHIAVAKAAVAEIGTAIPQLQGLVPLAARITKPLEDLAADYHAARTATRLSVQAPEVVMGDLIKDARALPALLTTEKGPQHLGTFLGKLSGTADTLEKYAPDQFEKFRATGEAALSLAKKAAPGDVAPILERYHENFVRATSLADIATIQTPELKNIVATELGAIKAVPGASTAIVEQVQKALPGDLTAAPDLGRVMQLGKATAQQLQQTAQGLLSVLGQVKAMGPQVSKVVAAPLRTITDAMQNVAASLDVVAPNLAETVRARLKELFPRLAETGIIRNKISEEIRPRADDIIAAFQPAVSTDFSGAGRAPAGLYGTAFNAADLATAHTSYLATIRDRVGAWLSKMRPTVSTLDANRFSQMVVALENPALREGLDAAQRQVIDETDYLMKAFRQIGHGQWFANFVERYLPRIVTWKSGLTELERTAAQSRLISMLAEGRATTRFAKERTVPFFSMLLKMESEGLLTVEKDYEKVIGTYFHEWGQVAANERLVDTLAHNKAPDGLPLLLNRTNALAMVRRLGADESALQRYVTVKNVPVLSDYVIHPDISFVKDFFGPQSITATINQDTGLWRNLQKMNMVAKGGLFLNSAFHAVELTGKLFGGLGTRNALQFVNAGLNKLALYRATLGRVVNPLLDTAFMKATMLPGQDAIQMRGFASLWGEAGEFVEFGLRHGLEFDPADKLATNQWIDFMRGIRDAVGGAEAKGQATISGPGGIGKVLRSPITGLLHVNEMLHKTTWEYVHNTGKLLVFQKALLDAAKREPGVAISELAKDAASHANAVMGGLNWRQMFGNAKVKTALQAFMLSPDWTFSNLKLARDVFVGVFADSLPRDAVGRFIVPFRGLTSPQRQAQMARQFWINTFASIFLTKQAMNYAFTGHSTFENPGGPDRWLDVWTGDRDPKNGQPIFMHFLKAANEPFELLADPVAFVSRKASPMAQVIGGVSFQRDRFGVPITMPEDSLGVAVLKNLGYVASRAVPIPFSNAEEAIRRASEGRLTTYDMLNPLTSTFDLSFIRKKLEKGQKAALDGVDLPSALPADLVIPRQTRFIH